MSSTAPSAPSPAAAPASRPPESPPFRPDPDLIRNAEGDERARKRTVAAARTARSTATDARS